MEISFILLEWYNIQDKTQEKSIIENKVWGSGMSNPTSRLA